jgi:ubiquinone biosynthesis protein
LQAYGVMIFQSDRFHADPHPGNLFALEGDRLGMIDFGEVGSIDPAERSALLRMVTALLGRDGEALAAAVLSVSRTTRTVDQTEFGGELARLLDPVADASLQDLKLGETLVRLLHLLRTSGIVLPTDLAILMKTLIECEATTNELDPTMSMLNLVGELGAFAPRLGLASNETSGESSD